MGLKVSGTWRVGVGGLNHESLPVVLEVDIFA